MAETADELAARSAVQGWRQRQADLALGRQRSQVETSKLLVTFGQGVSAALVATALQVGEPTGWDYGASAVVALAFLAALGVIFLDRLKEPNSDYVDQRAQQQGWTELQRIAALETLSIAAQGDGEEVVRGVIRLASIQVVLSIFAATLSLISLLWA